MAQHTQNEHFVSNSVNGKELKKNIYIYIFTYYKKKINQGVLFNDMNPVLNLRELC